MSKLERDFQADLIKELRDMLPGCIILKNDASYLQGVPDLIIIHRHKWAFLEVKRHAFARIQPNQEYYVDLLDSWSFASFIWPENKEVVLNDLQRSLHL